MSTRRKLTAIDDPLFETPGPPPARTMSSESARPEKRRTAALYVELPIEQWDALARAAFELRTHKRRIVTALIAQHVDATSANGRAALAALVDAHRSLEE